MGRGACFARFAELLHTAAAALSCGSHWRGVLCVCLFALTCRWLLEFCSAGAIENVARLGVRASVGGLGGLGGLGGGMGGGG